MAVAFCRGAATAMDSSATAPCRTVPVPVQALAPRNWQLHMILLGMLRADAPPDLSRAAIDDPPVRAPGGVPNPSELGRPPQTASSSRFRAGWIVPWRSSQRALCSATMNPSLRLGARFAQGEC